MNQIPAACALGARVDGDGPETSSPTFDPAPLLAFHGSWRALLESLAAQRDPDFDPDCTVGSIGRVVLRDGQAHLTFDLRPIPGVDPRRAVQPLEKLAEVECVRMNPPLHTSPDSQLVRAVVRAQEARGLEARVATKATCTEAGLLSAAGLDAVVIGAGVSVGNVHRPNEHTRISELELMRGIYGQVIRELCVEAA